MTRAGGDNPWRDEENPAPLSVWLEAGIPEDEAERWRGWHFPLSQAQAWRTAGVDDAVQAALWCTAGATPAAVGQWRSAHIEATEAVHWHEFGFSHDDASRHKAAGLGPSEAFTHDVRPPPVMQNENGRATGYFTHQNHIRRFADAGVIGNVLQGYVTRQWFDDEALGWAIQGIDAGEAPLWRELGLAPAEAGHLVRRGYNVAALVKQWWCAGVPFDEVADWLGAGFGPKEAGQQRAHGVTAAQAAALRARPDEPQ